MKKFILSTLITMIVSGCSSGSSNKPSGYTQYNLQNYLLTATQTNNCKLDTSKKSTLNCDSTGTWGGIYQVTFNTPTGVPGAYVVMPPQKDTYGLNIAATASGCDQKAPESGQKYTCTFTIGVNGTAQANHAVYLQINGKLGLADIITINIQ